MPKFVDRIFSTLKSAGARLLSGSKREFNRVVKVGNFDLDAHIQTSEFNNGTKGTKDAAEWLRNGYKSGDLEQHKGLMESGKLYYFNYPNPKHRKTLAFYDANPLVLSLGHYIANSGDLIEIGINLHHLPLKVRRQVLVKIFDMYKVKYKGQMYRSEQATITLEWQVIARPLLAYGAGFAFRSYIPKRRYECIEFLYEDWNKATYVPSLKYVGATEGQIAKEWSDYVKNKAFKNMSASNLADILGSY